MSSANEMVSALDVALRVAAALEAIGCASMIAFGVTVLLVLW
jgi:hypothetical protein